MITNDYIMNTKGNEITFIVGAALPRRFIIERVTVSSEGETLILCTGKNKSDVIVQLEPKHASYIWSKRETLSELSVVWNSSGVFPPDLKHLTGAVIENIEWALN